MKIEEAYTLWSTTYDSDRNLTRDLDQLTTERVLTGKSYENVMEIGCGTGKNTAFLTRIGRKILAVDFSLGMLRKAKAKVASQSVLFIVADLIRPWPCKPKSLDLIVCNLVLEHVKDLSAIFSQASQALAAGGLFFINELHPFRQYQGAQAEFRGETDTVRIPAFVHHVSEFTMAAEQNGLSLKMMKELWHEQDQNRLPRLISFIFEK
jgi:SAM-dependent methyltransferase